MLLPAAAHRSPPRRAGTEPAEGRVGTAPSRTTGTEPGRLGGRSLATSQNGRCTLHTALLQPVGLRAAGRTGARSMPRAWEVPGFTQVRKGQPSLDGEVYHLYRRVTTMPVRSTLASLKPERSDQRK